MSKSHRLLLVLGLLTLALAALPLSAQQPPMVEYSIKYYSDNSYTTVVGGKLIDCCANTYIWGRTTSWSTDEQWPCGECMPEDWCGGDPECDPVRASAPTAANRVEQRLERQAYEQMIGTRRACPLRLPKAKL